MKFKEEKNGLEIDLPKLNIDMRFTVWDSKQKKYVPADYISKFGLPDTHFNIALVAGMGGGKTSTMVSMVTSKKPESRVYYGCFDKIILCCDIISLRSIKGDPFKDIRQDQIFPEFNLQFLKQFEQIVLETSSEGKDTLLIVDDAGMRLKSDKKLHDAYLQLLMVHRHLRFSTISLIQDIISGLSLPIRNLMSCLILWKQTNNKREELIREEYLNMSREDYRQFVNFVYRNPHDSLMIRLTRPPVFYRNFKKLSFFDDDGKIIEGHCKCSDKSKCNCHSKSKDIKLKTLEKPEPPKEEDEKKDENITEL
jgi:hypothetical protein